MRLSLALSPSSHSLPHTLLRSFTFSLVQCQAQTLLSLSLSRSSQPLCCWRRLIVRYPLPSPTLSCSAANLFSSPMHNSRCLLVRYTPFEHRVQLSPLCSGRFRSSLRLLTSSDPQTLSFTQYDLIRDSSFCVRKILLALSLKHSPFSPLIVRFDSSLKCLLSFLSLTHSFALFRLVQCRSRVSFSIRISSPSSHSFLSNSSKPLRSVSVVLLCSFFVNKYQASNLDHIIIISLLIHSCSHFVTSTHSSTHSLLTDSFV
jgi:hypothetical protein